MHGYEFDRYLRYDELTRWLRTVAESNADLVTMESYGRSHEGRELWLMTVTDSATGAPHTKPAHWVDASIHAVELTATVGACWLLRHLVQGAADGDATVVDALRTRTFYIAPRVNPDGSEWVLADQPVLRRSSTRPWPWDDGHRWPGIEPCDIDGDGRVLQMRIEDPDGAWMPHPDAPRLMMLVPPTGAPDGTPRYRLLREADAVDVDDTWSIPTPPPREGLDLNRNFPSGWDTSVPGAGDHPLSEPEIDALARAIRARPNICGANAFHTAAGVLLRPSSTRPDADLSAFDLWVFDQLGDKGTELTDYKAHSVYEDFTWDKNNLVSGAADDWLYDHLGVYSWTTEFWDVVKAATGKRQSTHTWFLPPTESRSIEVFRWVEANDPDGYVDWYPFDHPALGQVELGGFDFLHTHVNPPLHLLRDEVAGHADFAVFQALCSPRLELRDSVVEQLGDDLWRVSVRVVNTGWLPTQVTAHAAKKSLVLPLTIELSGDAMNDGSATVIDGPARVQLGQLAGRADLGFNGGVDGTADRAQHHFVVRAAEGTALTITAVHQRAGTVTGSVDLATA